MNFTVNSQQLAVELRLLNKVVQNKPTIPILGYILVDADERGLRLMATDMEIFFSTTCRAKITTPGAVALPAVKLLAMVERFSDADVNITVEKSAVTIRCGTFTSRLSTLDHSDYPHLPDVTGVSSDFAGETLRGLILKTRCAVIEGNQKYILRGALLSMVGAGAVMVATDAKRLAVASAGRQGPDARAVIPTKTLDILSVTDAAKIGLTISEQHLFFSLPDNGADRLLVSRMIEGDFPKYERVIPRSNDKIVQVDRSALAAALRRVGTVSEESKAVYFNVVSNAIELSSSSAEVGFADEIVEAQYAGADLKICVNGSHVLDFLEAASGARISMNLKDGVTPMLLMDGESYLTVILPIKQ